MEQNDGFLRSVTLAAYGGGLEPAEVAALPAGCHNVAGLVIEIKDSGDRKEISGLPVLYSEERIRGFLPPQLQTTGIFVFPVCDSTNARLLSGAPWNEDRCGGGAPPAGPLAVAELQSAGRGRWGRRWCSPPFVGAWFSLWVPQELIEGALLQAVAAAGVLRALQKWCGAELKLLWPNDITVEGRKLGGILIEQGRGGFAAGIGINVSGDPNSYGISKAPRPPGALREVAEAVPDRNELIAACFSAIVEFLKPERRREALDLWKSAQVISGGRVRLLTGGGVRVGKVAELDPRLGLRLEGEARWLVPQEVIRVGQASSERSKRGESRR